MQVLHIGQGRYLKVQHSFADAGEPAQYGMSGGVRILLSKGTRPKPEVFMCDGGFYYKNGAAVTQRDDIDWLPEPYREQALAFVDKAQTENKPKSAPVFTTKEAAVAPKRGRGRPKKAAASQTKKQNRIVIKDEDSLLDAAGYNQDDPED